MHMNQIINDIPGPGLVSPTELKTINNSIEYRVEDSIVLLLFSLAANSSDQVTTEQICLHYTVDTVKKHLLSTSTTLGITDTQPSPRCSYATGKINESLLKITKPLTFYFTYNN